MKTDESALRLHLITSALSLLLGLLGVFVSAWFAVPGVVLGAVVLARTQTQKKALPGQKGVRRLMTVFASAGFVLSLITLIALAVNMTAALSR